MTRLVNARITFGLAALAVLLSAPDRSRAQLYVPTDASDTIVSTGIDDNVYGPFNLGFTFTSPFFGGSKTQINLSSNGNLQFGTTNTSYGNSGFPYSTPMIAPIWDDLLLPPGTLRINNTRTGEFDAFWDGVRPFSEGGTVTAEAILLGAGNRFGLAAGSIIFSYGDITNTRSDVTVGLNNGSSAVTLNGLVTGAQTNGVIGEPDSYGLSNRTFLFTLNGSGGYDVREGVSVVPEPATLVHTAIAALTGIAFAYRRRRRKVA